MYTVKIRDHMMIAHSLPDPFFGPAQNLHGATFIVDAEFLSPALDPHNVVIDIGLAAQVLDIVLEPLRYRNLDELPEFGGKLTTTEFMARYVHDRIREQTQDVFTGKIRVTIAESDTARASYGEDD